MDAWLRSIGIGVDVWHCLTGLYAFSLESSTTKYHCYVVSLFVFILGCFGTGTHQSSHESQITEYRVSLSAT